MKLFQYISLYITFSILLGACSGSKSYYKKAMKLQEAGMHSEASEFFLTALRKNPNNVDARIAIKTNGQKVLDKKLADFYQAYAAEDYKKAVYDYMKARDFYESVNAFASINFIPYYEDYFKEAREKYLSKQYTDALVLKQEGQFEAANKLFKEILEIYPNYEDVSDMERLSRLEPIYQKGKAAMATDQFREAYYHFDELLQSGDYKDAKDLKKASLDEAAFTIAFIPVKYERRDDQEVADKFYSMVMEELLKLNNPFIKLIDRSNIERIIEEQKLAMTGVVDASSSAKAGKILGAKAVINIKVIDYKTKLQAPKSTQRIGYQAITVKKYNKVTDSYYKTTSYKKVYYREIYGANTVSANIRYDLSSTETAEVLVSDLLTSENSDRINYALFEGDYRSLYPGSWRSMKIRHSDDKIGTDFKSKNALNRKLTTKKRSLKSADVLRVELLNDMAKKVAIKIEQYDKSL